MNEEIADFAVDSSVQSKRRYLSWLLLVPFTALLAASIGASYLAYAPNSTQRSVQQPQATQVGMGITECSKCHNSLNSAADIYVAVNGVELHPYEMLTMAPGQSFEIDFHFGGMLGDPRRFTGVGFQIIVPTKPSWRVSSGNLSHPKDWSPEGEGASLWSPAWDKAASATGNRVTRWVEAADAKGAFRLTLGEQPLNSGWAPVVFDDRGVVEGSDTDSMADHSGADALITIPSATPVDEYEIVVSGVGHDGRNVRAMVSFHFTVQVNLSLAVRAAPTRAPISPAQSFGKYCSRCHSLTPEFLSAVADRSSETLAELVTTGASPKPHQNVPKQGGLSPEEVDILVQYLRQQAFFALRSATNGGPKIPHTVRNRLNCLDCHGPTAPLPMPKTHGYNSDSLCGSCHYAPTGGAPPIPHSYKRGDRCLSCHTKGGATGVKPMTESHGNRSDGSCLSCHFDTRSEALLPSLNPGPLATKADGSNRTVPKVKHFWGNSIECLVCHDFSGVIRPVPSSHCGRSEESCLGCHEPI